MLPGIKETTKAKTSKINIKEKKLKVPFLKNKLIAKATLMKKPPKIKIPKILLEYRKRKRLGTSPGA